jgi:phosphatidylglycerophosphate synthase
VLIAPGAALAAAWVGGLTIFHRALLTLQRAGITRIVVVTGDEHEPLRRAMADDPRLAACVRWMPAREFPPGDAKTWDALRGDIRGAVLVLCGAAVFSRDLVDTVRAALQSSAKDGELLLVYAQTGDAEPAVVVLPAEWLVAAGPVLARGEPALLQQAVAASHLKSLSLDGGPAWFERVRGPADLPAAERRLFASLRGRYEGLVDTYFNRLLSAPLTRVFVGMGLSANAVTIVSIMIGLAAAFGFSIGTYGAAVAGAVLFQLAAVVDCCDGEVARLTFSESWIGQQLDIMGDNVVHMAIFAALGWAGYHQQHSTVPLLLAAAAIVGNALSLAMVLRADARRARGELRRPGQAGRVEFLLRHVASRDFSVIVLLFTLAHALPLFLWLAAIGSNVFWVVTAAMTHTGPRSA